MKNKQPGKITNQPSDALCDFDTHKPYTLVHAVYPLTTGPIIFVFFIYISTLRINKYYKHFKDKT